MLSLLPEISPTNPATPALVGELSSESFVMSYKQTAELLERNGLLKSDIASASSNELLR